MARRFHAPIPITHPWIAQARQGPRARDARRILQESGVPSSKYDRILQDWQVMGEESARHNSTNLFTAAAVAQLATEISEFYREKARDLEKARGTDSAFAMDDYSLLTFSNTTALLNRSALVAMIGEQESPTPNMQEQVDFLLGRGKWRTSCVHERPHDRLGKRGRRTTVSIRAATWGTYILSWLVGNEALAVRIWNRLFLSSEFRWVPEAYSETAEGRGYALKKYLDAKRRLAKDVSTYVNPMVFQGLPPVTPPPPLDPDTGNLVLWILDATLRLNVLVLARGFPKTSPLETMALSMMAAAGRSVESEARNFEEITPYDPAEPAGPEPPPPYRGP